MAALYHSLFTEKGLELLRESIQNGTKLGITHMSFGDGNGSLPTPDAKFTQMVNEVYRTALNRLAPSKENPNWLEADGVIPSAVGGFNIREVGLWAGNDMVAYANYPPTYKPSGDQGTAQIKTIRIVLQIDNTANFELKIDASVVMATIQSVNDAKQNIYENTTGKVECLNDLNDLIAWNGRTVYSKSYHMPTNFALAQPYLGGGTRVYVESRKNENDGFLCVNGWVLQVENNIITPDHAGAKADDKNFDSSEALQKCINLGFIVQLKGVYYTQYPLIYSNDTRIIGTGEDSTCGIVKTTNNKLNLGNKIINNVTMNFDVDAVLIAIPKKNWYVNNAHLDGFFVSYDSSLAKRGIGLYSSLIAMCSFKNIKISNCEYGVKTVDAWMVTWERVQASADCGFWLGATDTNWTANGTSNTFISCWSTNTKQGYSAWKIYSLQYSTFLSCGVDHCGEDGKPAESVFDIRGSDIVFLSMGSEIIHAYTYLHSENSNLIFKNLSVQVVHNKYKKSNLSWYNANAMFQITNNSRVTLEGGHFDCFYTSINSEFSAAFAFVEGNSLFVTDKTLKHFSSLEEVKATDGIFSFTKYGIYKDSAGSIDVAFKNDIIKIGNRFGTLNTTESICDRPLNIVGKSLNDQRNLGAINFVNGSNNDATTDKNYPKNGTGHIVQQISAQDHASKPNSVQFDYAFDKSVINGVERSIGNIYVRYGAWNVDYSTWYKIWTESNTTVTADGTLKAASPIVKLYSDHIECNDEAEEQNPLFEKLGTGHYLVKNTLGFAQEGWWIDIPSDSNGNKICAIKYQTLEDGDIEVRTFKRKFDIETASIIADEENPIDIPENMNGEQRWIDIRLHQLTKDVSVDQPIM
ncbi:phage tail protein [Acinetobacter ursingii]|uniref:phage tail protein n=1 Tax=Acinetobacter ursingii TaxID=108980 RepID=UPI003AF4B6C2